VLRICNKGLTRNFVIYDEADQQAIVKQTIRRMGLDTKQLASRTFLFRISWAKNRTLDFTGNLPRNGQNPGN
jgi:ATP-dependent DNA helicase UvrD/PcrA